jgi:hypothetical protein
MRRSPLRGSRWTKPRGDGGRERMRKRPKSGKSKITRRPKNELKRTNMSSKYDKQLTKSS